MLNYMKILSTEYFISCILMNFYAPVYGDFLIYVYKEKDKIQVQVTIQNL